MRRPPAISRKINRRFWGPNEGCILLMASDLANKRTSFFVVILPVILVFAVAVLLSGGGRKLIAPEWADPDLQRGLTRPLRLEVLQSNALSELEVGLRAFHYRTRPRRVAIYSDVFYDTDDWELYRAGYSFRFRESKDDAEGRVFGVRLEREPRFTPKGAKKTEVREAVPALLGEAIARGEWEDALSTGNGLDATTQLLTILERLSIAPEALRPKLVAQLRRQRFDVTDKGQSWFELDYETWTFHPFEDADRHIRFEDVVIDTRLKSDDPELVRRVVTMNRLSQMIHSVRTADRAPYERAVEWFEPGTAN